MSIFTPILGHDPIWLIFVQLGWNHQLGKEKHEGWEIWVALHIEIPEVYLELVLKLK